jgi:hypothetical protein
MKTKLILLIGAAVLGLAVLSPAQSLIEKTPVQERAEKVSKEIPQTMNYLEMKLRSFYRDATVKGEEQAFMDAYGTKAVQALTWYAKTRACILEMNPTANIPAPDPKVFVVQKDGKVQYVAPPEPEKPAVVPRPNP